MTSLWIGLGILSAAVCGFAVLSELKAKNGLRLLLAAEDEDIKIAPGSFSSARSAEDAAELAAREFLKQKNSGNIDRARELGRRFADAVIHVENGPLAGELDQRPMQVQHHQYLLYTFVVNRVIAEYSPDSILAQTSLNVFFSEIEGASEELNRHVNDMAAFSLYILCERSRSRSDDEIGRIFAELCGSKDDPDMIGYGNHLYGKLYRSCADIVKEIPYEPVDE